MGTPVSQWNIYPGHFWLRGEPPEKLVEYDDSLQMWNVYGYPEAVEVLTQPKVFSNDTKHLDPVKWDDWVNAGDFAQMDPPQHRTVRGLVDYAFTPKLIGALEGRIHGLVGGLLDDLEGKDRFDLVSEVSIPLTVTVIAELLGVPVSDRPMIHVWMERLLAGAADFEPPEVVREQKDELRQALDLLREMHDYWTDLATQRRRQPREDLITELVQAEVDGDRLTDAAISNISNRLLIAGHHSTAILISNTVLCLDTFPDQAARVRADRSLITPLIEESLRYLSPISAVGKCTTTDAEVGGVRIPKDQMLMVWVGAANRDSRQFAEPHRFDAGREPNAHLGFGRGVHFCLGRRLARMEARVAIGAFLDRYPDLRTDLDQPPTFYQIADATGVDSLPVLTGGRRSASV